LGDSWTQGWGVQLEDSYPKQLEKYLRSNNKNVEVINCGQTGAYTTLYLQYLEKLLSTLKPDLILLGMTQGDDLSQLLENDSSYIPIAKKNSNIFNKLKTAARMFLRSSIGNIVDRFRPNQQLVVRENWLQSATSMIENFSVQDKIRFGFFEDTVQQLFRTGNLNPHLMYYYMNYPDGMCVINNPAHPATRRAIAQMDKDLREMKASCEKHNSSLIFVNLPSSKFTGHQTVTTPLDILNPYFVSNNKIDSIYHSLAAKNNISYIEMTSHFINLPDKTSYFFKFDLHPTALGYKEIACYIGEQLLNSQNLEMSLIK
jgi:hypothetical protein